MTRRMCFGMMAVAVVASVLGGIAGAVLVRPAAVDAQTGIYTAREFRMIGPDGSVRGVFKTLADGQAVVVLFDGSGNSRVWMRAPVSGESAVAIAVNEKTPVAVLSANPGGPGWIAMYDSTGYATWQAP